MERVLVLYSSFSTETQLADDVTSKFMRMVPKPMQHQISKFLRWQDRQAALLGKLLLQNGFKRLDTDASLDQIFYTLHNKPYLPEGPSFNISHSGGYVVCALSTTVSVGIDIELMRPVSLEDFTHQLTTGESEFLRTHPDQIQAFYRYWTEKEAVIKANGKGLSIPLTDFEVVNRHTRIGEESWYTKDVFIHPSYYCSLSTNKRNFKIDLVDAGDMFM